MRIEFENGKTFLFDSNTDPYYRLFLSNVALNESCYECKYKGRNSKADISIGDYWGGEVLNPDFYNPEGTSLVIVRSKKGQALFEKIRDDAHVISVDYESATKYNLCVADSVKRPKERDTIFQDLKKYSFDDFADKYVSFSKKEKIKLVLSKIGLLEFAVSLKRFSKRR